MCLLTAEVLRLILFGDSIGHTSRTTHDISEMSVWKVTEFVTHSKEWQSPNLCAHTSFHDISNIGTFLFT